MSGGTACKCPQSQRGLLERQWVVRMLKGNRSAFNGYRFQASDYSAVQCLECRATWRTRSGYVYRLKHQPYA